ncbi:hypothetical protein BC628DRAFT_1341327 [Trametes gibbosa]|nr:hypothetical protein BC628DRAFT_1341327 [Trametes gibbosa]
MNSPPVFAQVPSLDSTIGAFLIGTSLGLITVETFHMITCTHACYTYLVTNYFNPETLSKGTWSIQLQAITCAIEIIITQMFYARRAFLLRRKNAPVVALAVFCSITAFAFAAAATVERPSSALKNIPVGGRAHDKYRSTNHLIDRLILYAVNTGRIDICSTPGLLTGVLNFLALVLIRVLPNLVSFGIAVVVTQETGKPDSTSVGINFVVTQGGTVLTDHRLWRSQQLPERSVTAIELKSVNVGSQV